MSGWLPILLDVAIILVLIAGFRQFRTTRGARWGNLTGALALACAAAVVLVRQPVLGSGVAVVVGAFVVGGSVGWLVSSRVNMLQIPAMVAFQHGCGGIAALLVSFVELTRGGAALTPAGEISGLLGVVLGAGTFSGSMIAGGKLAGRLRQTPVVLAHHNAVLLALCFGIIVLAAVTGAGLVSGAAVFYCVLAMAAISVGLGAVFAIRIGGADMPVLISFLNATAGLAASLCGIIIGNRLLIACGATVAASGSILTHIMCKAMNRRLVNVFAGLKKTPVPATAPAPKAPAAAAPAASLQVAQPSAEDQIARAVQVAKAAKTVVIIPGYGMALAHAQFEVVRLAETLRKRGADVKFAVHPIAGRMPGHMHVLLAEAEVDSDLLFEMDQVNGQFKDTDLSLVVGACDVVNPSAISVPNTPIFGMPILLAHEAKCVVVCNLDDRPGYSGVANSLYSDPKTILLLGDAKATLGKILEQMGP